VSSDGVPVLESVVEICDDALSFVVDPDV